MAESITWQTMESAPKDGAAILVYTDRMMAVVRWSDPDRPYAADDPYGAKSKYAYWHVNDNKHGPFALRGPEPTHWMPLPAKPGG
jgi:hypothetical protein